MGKKTLLKVYIDMLYLIVICVLLEKSLTYIGIC